MTAQKIPLAQKLIDLLFLRLEGIYGHAWSSRHSNPTNWKIAKDEWAAALGNASPEVIRKVLDQLRSQGDTFPPSLPMFLKLCRQYNGFPDEEEAYQMALRRDFSHPIAKMCFDKIGSWDFTHDSEKVLRKKFWACYKQMQNQLTHFHTDQNSMIEYRNMFKELD